MTAGARWLQCLAIAAVLWLQPLNRSYAAVLDGTLIPETLQADGQPLVLNGAALRAIPVLQIKTYAAALYLPRKMQEADAILRSSGSKAVVVHYLHGASRQQVQDRYRAGEMNNCGDGHCDRALAADYNRLVNDAPPVEPGDTTVFLVNGRGLQVSFNGKPYIRYGNTALGNLIISGFIGPHAPSAAFRAALLGQSAP